jgi:hypothetical protein
LNAEETKGNRLFVSGFCFAKNGAEVAEELGLLALDQMHALSVRGSYLL